MALHLISAPRDIGKGGSGTNGVCKHPAAERNFQGWGFGEVKCSSPKPTLCNQIPYKTSVFENPQKNLIT